MKKKLSLLMTLLLCAVMGAWADYYTPTADEEVIILNEVYDANATDAGYSKHSAVAWAGTQSTTEKKAGDPANNGAATSSNVPCFPAKGNGGGKNITISVTGVSKIIVYHESHSSRYLELRSGSKSGDLIGKGAVSTYFTEVDLDGSTGYDIFLHGTDGKDQDLYVYAVKLVKAAEATEKTIYLKPGVWAANDARFAVFAFNDTENTWIDFAAVEGDEGVYNATVPVAYTKIILARMNPATDENNWDNRWNQTADINFAEIVDNAQFTITDWSDYEVGTYTAPVEYTVTFATDAGWEKVYAYAYTGDTPVTAWPGEDITENVDDGVYTYTFKATSAPEKIIFGNGGSVVGVSQTAAMDFEDGKAYKFFASWTVAGTALFGADWDVNAEANDMVLDENTGLYTWSARVQLSKNVSFKVVKNHSWDAGSYPENDYEITISEAGWYDVVITFDAENTEVAATATKLELDELAAVTGDATWDWSNFGGSDIELSGTTAPTNTDEFVLSNAVKFGLCESIGEEFGNAQQLAVVTQYVTRTQSNKHFMQGNTVKFNTIVPGTVKVWFSNTGTRKEKDEEKRFLYINGNNTNVCSLNTNMTEADMHVDAGEVVINAYIGVENPTATMVRISKIQFVADEYFLVGTFNMDGESWVTGDENYKLTLNEDCTETVEYMINVDLPANTELKVLNTTTNTWYPSVDNSNFTVNNDGNYTIYFRPNADGGDDWHYNYIYAVNNGFVNMNITAAGYATFSNVNEVAIPENVTAYYALKQKENTIILEPINGGYIPANTGVVVAGAAGTYKANVNNNTGAALAGTNLLKPWLTAGTPKEETYYTLAVDEEGNPVFKKSAGGTLAAGKAYLVLPAETGAHTLDVVFGDATGISATLKDNGEMTNGQPVYNLAGQRVSKPTKGLYIVGGKKVALR